MPEKVSYYRRRIVHVASGEVLGAFQRVRVARWPQHPDPRGIVTAARDLRLAVGATQADVALAMRVTEGTVTRIEARATPALRTAHAYAEAVLALPATERALATSRKMQRSPRAPSPPSGAIGPPTDEPASVEEMAMRMRATMRAAGIDPREIT